MGVGVEADVTDGHLSLVWDMGGDSGDELQIIHPCHLSSSFPIPVAYLSFFFIEGEAFQGKQRPNHVFPHPLGLFPGFSPDLAVDRKAGVAPAFNFLHQDLRDELLAKEKREDLAFGISLIREPEDAWESPGFPIKLRLSE